MSTHSEHKSCISFPLCCMIQRNPCSQIVEAGTAEQWDHHMKLNIGSAGQRKNSLDDWVLWNTLVPHWPYSAVRRERSWTGCISWSAASEVYRPWRQECCRTWKPPRSASQPSSEQIEVGREDIHSTHRGHHYSVRLGLWWRHAQASTETLSLTTCSQTLHMEVAELVHLAFHELFRIKIKSPRLLTTSFAGMKLIWRTSKKCLVHEPDELYLVGVLSLLFFFFRMLTQS